MHISHYKLAFSAIWLLIFLFFSVNLKAGINTFNTAANLFFSEYVDDNLIDYDSIRENTAKLDELVNLINKMDVESLTENEQKAFLINAYNILVIKNVIKHYPLRSPLDVAGFFNRHRFNVGGKQMTLDEIQKEELQKNFNDARIHFVLVCAAVSCPPITSFAYEAPKLEEQLDKQTRKTINDPDFIRVNHTRNNVQLSEIFNWYAADFLTESDGLIEYINQYREQNIPETYRVSFYDYDWQLNKKKMSKTPDVQPVNIQTYTPSTLLRKGQYEIQLFNNLYTQTAYRDGDRNRIELGERSTFFTGLFYFLVGVTNNSRLNVGFDVNFRSVRIDSDKSTLPFSVFRFENTTTHRTTISSLGPKIKFAPFKNVSGFSVQSAFWFPVAADLEADSINQPWLDFNRYIWWNQFFYDYSLNRHFQLFLSADLLFRFAKNSKRYPFNEPKNSNLSTPVSAFLNYFPIPSATLYVMLEHAPTFENTGTIGDDFSGKYARVAHYTQAGIGGKYQLTPSLNIELLYTYFFDSMNAGAGQTFNLGLRYLR